MKDAYVEVYHCKSIEIVVDNLQHFVVMNSEHTIISHSVTYVNDEFILTILYVYGKV